MGFSNNDIDYKQICSIEIPKGSPLNDLSPVEREVFVVLLIKSVGFIYDKIVDTRRPEGSQDGLEGQSF